MTASTLDHSVLRERLVLTGSLVTRTGLRIGGQQSTQLLGSDLPVIRDASGFPFIPGSSLKGVLRSTVESLLRGLGKIRPERPFACDPFENPCHGEDTQKRDALQKLAAPAALDAELRRTCDVCLLFGSPIIAARLAVADLYVPDAVRAFGLGSPIRVRDGVGIDRDTETARDGIKYDFEVVDPGTRFELRIVLDNPAPHDLALLAAGLDAMNGGGARLGGGTSRGLGFVSVSVDRLEALSARAMLGLEEAGATTYDDRVKASRAELRKLAAQTAAGG